MSEWGVAEWRDFLWIVQLAASVVLALALLWLKTQFATRGDVAAANERIDDVEERVNAIEAKMAGLATREDITKILVKLEHSDGERKALAAKVDGIDDKLTRLERPLDLIQEHLMAQGRAR